MSENSKIEWTDHTFNPWIGCTKVSPGCAHCYAEARDQRFAGGVHWGKGAARKLTSEANWRQPLRWHAAAGLCKCGADVQAGALHDCPAGRYDMSYFAKQRRAKVFCASLADWLDDEVPVEWLARLLALIHATPNLDWLLLTKRPEHWRSRIEAALKAWPHADPMDYADRTAAWLSGARIPAHVWIGTTVEDQARAEERIPALLAIPARVRFLSCEPLLGPVDIAAGLPIERHVTGDVGIDWVIAGGESGPGARPMHPQWARDLRDQCAGGDVPFFFKQWGEWVPSTMSTAGRYCFVEPDGKVSDPAIVGVLEGDGTIDSEIMHRPGKHAAGRLLDGVEHSAFPPNAGDEREAPRPVRPIGGQP